MRCFTRRGELDAEVVPGAGARVQWGVTERVMELQRIMKLTEDDAVNAVYINLIN